MQYFQGARSTEDGVRAIRTAIADFGAAHCSPEQLRERDARQEAVHSPTLLRALASAGWTGLTVPAEYGGHGAGIAAAVTLLEELEYRRVAVFGLCATLVVAEHARRFGTPDQRHAVFSAMMRGESHSIAMTEAEAGSDVAAMTATARRTDRGWVLDARKRWVATAADCDHLVVVCRSDPDSRRHRGLSMYLLPRRTQGVDVHPVTTLAGPHVDDVDLHAVEVGAETLLGAEGAAWTQVMSGLTFERMLGSGLMLGLARRALDDTIDYVRNRRQFGRSIGDFQAVRHRLANLATEVECTSALVRATARSADTVDMPELELRRAASMCKLKASELARETALEGMQLLGAAGYSDENQMAKLTQRALAMTIYGGTSEIQRDVIAGTLDLSRK